MTDAFDKSPGGVATMGASLMAAGMGDKAVALAGKLAAERADDPLAAAVAEIILTHEVPKFHAGMLHDDRRNQAFEEAIVGSVAGKSVLDIGAGSGLLAMIAARAGAGRVYACEANSALAATAREIVAANGFGEGIRILSKHSTNLDPEADLDGGVDVIVSEIFAHDLIREGCLPSLGDAMARLARPGAVVLPARAAIRVALAHHDGPIAAPVGEVCGFDLARFNRHARRSRNVAPDGGQLALRSEGADLFGFDFQNERAFPERRGSVEVRGEGGPVNGIAQWIRLDLTDDVAYENAPGAPSHWSVIFHPFAPFEAKEGESFTIGGWHDAHRTAVWLERG